jgi:hypothetical protein
MYPAVPRITPALDAAALSNVGEFETSSLGAPPRAFANRQTEVETFQLDWTTLGHQLAKSDERR